MISSMGQTLQQKMLSRTVQFEQQLIITYRFLCAFNHVRYLHGDSVVPRPLMAIPTITHMIPSIRMTMRTSTATCMQRASVTAEVMRAMMSISPQNKCSNSKLGRATSQRKMGRSITKRWLYFIASATYQGQKGILSRKAVASRFSNVPGAEEHRQPQTG